MGRSYWFECSRCGYRARVSGRSDRGLDFFIQTVSCADCKALYDVVTRLRVPAEPILLGSLQRYGQGGRYRPPKGAPSFEAVLNRLPLADGRRLKWVKFSLQCPLLANHRVTAWNDPGKCPRCGVFMEKGALPYRIWE